LVPLEDLLHREDIPEDLRSQLQELLTERRLFHALLDHIPDTIYFKDTQSRFLRTNRAHARVLGIKDPSEAEGKSDYDFFSSEDAAGFFEDEQRTMQTGEALLDKTELVRYAAGEARWCSTTKIPLYSDEGEAIGLVGITRDITDRVRADEALRAAEQRQARLVEGLQTVMVVAQELMGLPDLDTVCRRGVELARERLGVERCSIFLREGDRFKGTYGTDDHGQTTREHETSFASPDWTTHYREAADGRRSWSVRQAEWLYGGDGETVEIGQGWVASTPILGSATLVGFMFNDAALTDAPVDEITQDIVAVYCSALGVVIERVRTEEQLAAVSNAAPVGIHAYDLGPDGGLTFRGGNPAADAMLKIDHRQFIGRPIEDVFPALAGSEVLERYRWAAAYGEPWHVESLPYVDGWIQGTFELHAFQTAPGQMAVMFSDVTERRQMEQDLRRTQFAIDHVAEAAFWMDSQGRFVYVNEQACRSLGYSHAELLRMGIHDIDPSFFPEAWQAHWQDLKAHTTLALQTFHRTKDGREFPVEVTDNFVEFEGQEYNCAFARDITGRLRAQAALRESEQRYRLLAENATDVIASHDLDGTIVYVSPSCRSVLGYEPAEMVGHRVHEFIAEDSRSEVGARLGSIPANRVVYTVQYQFVKKDGSRVWMETTARATAAPHSEEPTGLLSISRDITERKRAEEERRQLEAELQHMQKLESLSVLAGGVAHDFNNILMGVLGNADLALMQLPPESPARPLVQQVETAAARAAELSRQMLAYSGRGTLIVETIDLSRLVDEVFHLLQSSISKKALLQRSLSASPCLLRADATQLRQVVMNLVINASEALGDSPGVITIETGAAETDAEELHRAYRVDYELPPGHYVYLQVSDTGCGMAPETRQRIFDPFFTTKFTGRGLGLAATLGIIRGHHGAVVVDSELGKGSVFRVLFPCAEGLSVPEVSAPADPTGWKGWKGSGVVLVADDEAYVRDIARHVLGMAGFEVVVAQDGQEVVEQFAQHVSEWVAVVLDLTMPRKTGEEAFDEIRAMREDIPVVLCSGYGQQEAERRFAGKALSAFLHKPYRPAELITRLREVVEAAQRPN